jgi:hypothetical protein
VINWHSHTKFREKRRVWGSSPENFYIFEARGLNFWHFLKQIRKQIACTYILTVFYKNGYHFTKIITLLRKFYLKMSNVNRILHDFCLQNFTVGAVLHPLPQPRSLRPDNHSLRRYIMT